MECDKKSGEKRQRDAESDDEAVDEGGSKKVMVGLLEVNQEDDVDLQETNSWYMDDRSGEVLDPKLVEIAEKEELDYMTKIGVGIESSMGECFEKTNACRKETTS